MTDFWKTLEKPFFVLAPMEDVTDTVFREVVLSVSSPDRLRVLVTEFTSVDGLCHPKGREAVIHRLMVNSSERELLEKSGVFLLAQIWGSDPEKFYQASRFIADNYHFDGIDINMGCPADKIVKQGACAALIGQNTLAAEIIAATREGSSLPVTVKTRTGIREHITGSWISHLLSCKVSAITLHARTRQMMSLKAADWEQVKIAAEIRDSIDPGIKIIGNGDVENYPQGLLLSERTGADGIMVGRGIFANPWFFSAVPDERPVSAKLDLLGKHILLYASTWKDTRNYNILKRFFKIYVHGFDGAASLRARLMESVSAGEALAAIHHFRS
ncbi:putative tRNA-dihydrouridine synthase [anaerobic digester metagenome]